MCDNEVVGWYPAILVVLEIDWCFRFFAGVGSRPLVFFGVLSLCHSVFVAGSTVAMFVLSS